ncbi:MAG: putative metal-binding motif-containing protein, partial [Bacteroidota bacterium]
SNGITYTPIPNSGTMNPLWNTNQLTGDTWYKVKSQNGPVGACPPDEVIYMIDVCPPFTISNFIAVLQAPPPSCAATGVNLSVDFSTPCPAGCQIKVTWTKNGQPLHVAFYTTSPATWFYSDPLLLGDYSGTYCAIVEGCCGEILNSSCVVIDPPCYAKLAVLNAQGLNVCYRCNNEPITLCGLLFNVPSGVSCTYQWCANGVPIPGATTLCITVYQANVLYTFKATCNGCVKEASYYLPQCGSGPYLFTFYRDFDSDDFGNVDSTLADDELPPGYVPDSTDCNDQNAAIHPGAPEICNNLDDDCNGNPEATTTNWTGNGDNLNWSDPANWSDGIVPLPCQHVVLPPGKIVKVAAGINAVSKTLDVPTTTQLTVEPTATMIIQN